MDQEGGNQMPVRPNAAPKQTKELKVEDALYYLDQVKMEFCDRPHVYNEFLEIMKNFKAQSINTPGVIERVKNLFKGYNNLILGFNTFLPEGEGYKIELTPEEQGHQPSDNDHPPKSSIPNKSNTAPSNADEQVGGSIPTTTSSISTAPPGSNLPVQTPGMVVYGYHPEIEQPANSIPSNMSFNNPPATQRPLSAEETRIPQAPVPSAPAGTIPGQPGQMQQAHAINYVTKIRNRFANEPDTYRSFLKILHTYQREQKGIKEVLEQVSQLFADHSDLLLEFTYFLPDAVQEQAKDRLQRAARESEARKTARMHAQKNRKPGAGAMAGNANMAMGGAHIPGFRNNAELIAGNMPVNLNNLNMVNDGPMNKRARNDRDPKMLGAMNMNMGMPVMMNNPGAAFAQQSYAMQMASGGMTDPTLAGQHPALGMSGNVLAMNKKQNAVAANNNLAANNVNSTNQRKQNRRKSGGQGDINEQKPIVSGGNGYGAGGNQSQAYRGAGDGVSGHREVPISVNAERKFFDHVKEALLSISRDAWSEFVKCLELFSNDVLSKEDMFECVSDLLAPVNQELVADFKRLIEHRMDYHERKEDMWFSMPLSEIDFTQCRKCTPSYRALPKNYPKPKCSERNLEESKVLNDLWVSIPIGSEESYSFKHMRKNQYEEALFKCEDERFEIDMIIDSNMSTIRILEPLAEEIANFKRLRNNSAAGNTSVSGAVNMSATATGSAVPRFNLQLEKRQLSTIHLNAIARIYGEHGEEILELLRKNPAGTIPVVLKRLRQKDLEWRKARQELNKHWKEVMEKNHYKSFDHRSFYFRQQDKKYLSTKQLVQEIISRFSNNNGNNHHADEQSVEENNYGMHFSLSAEHQSLQQSMQPQMVLTYENDCHLVHRDIYRIVCHAAETTLSLTSDRERLAALWRDLIRIFFNIPVHYLYSNTSTTSSSAGSIFASEEWPAGTKVFTTFGSGVIQSYKADSKCYVVALPFGTGFLNPAAIIGPEQLSQQALHAVGVTHDNVTNKDVIFNGAVRSEEKVSEVVQDPCKLFYGTQMCYIFLRLHHTLYVRLRLARLLATEALATYRERHGGAGRAANSSVLSTAFQDAVSGTSASIGFNAGIGTSAGETTGLEHIDKSRSVYNHFLGQVFALVEGSMDNARFEDFCRTLLGNKSYVLYTLDKIVVQMIKHLQAMANDDNVNKLIGLFVYHHNHQVQGVTASRGVDPVLYKNHVAQILSHTMEDVFRFQLFCGGDGIMAKRVDVAIQHLGVLPATQPTAGNSTSAPLSGDTHLLTIAADRMELVESSNANNHSGNVTSSASSNGVNSVSNNAELSANNLMPKAVISDDEEEEEDDEAESNKMSIEENNPMERKAVFSPRSVNK